MVFRRPRVNVKPNVQSSRPVTASASATVPSEPTNEQPSQTTESAPIVEDTVSVISNQEENVPSTTSVEPSPPPPPPPPPPATTTTTMIEAVPIVVEPTPTATPTTVRPVFRRKPVPNIATRPGIIHRRPSASCSGTESETESIRQKHTTASTISYTRLIPPTTTKSIPTAETQPTTTIESPEVSSVPKPEMIIRESSEPSSQTKFNGKISREYLIQHITYRAQRLAHKVESDKTTRKRRAAALGKIEKANANRDGPLDTSKLTIADFAHYNPTENPMEPKLKPTTTAETTKDPVRKQSFSGNEGQPVTCAPQLKIDANGSLTIDEESLYIRQVDEPTRTAVVIEGQFNDDNLTHRSYRKIGRRKRWNNRDTLRFYQALRMCGTDFALIANVFPNRDRDDIKRKFKTEDKANRTLVDAALSQRIPFDLTCFFSPSEESSEENNGSDVENLNEKKTRKRRRTKTKNTTSADPLEINRRREKRLQKRNNSLKIKKSAEFIDDDDDEDEYEDEDQRSMDIADTVEVTTSHVNQSKMEQNVQIENNVETSLETSMTNITELENLLGRIDGGHLLFVHNTDETTGLDRIDVHVVMSSNPTENVEEQSL